MQTDNDILLILTVIILVLTIVIAVLMWQIQRRRRLQERRREVIERENREAEALLRQREQGTGDGLPTFRDIESEVEHPQLTIPFDTTNKTMKYDNRCNDIRDAGCGGAAERHRLESFRPVAQAEAQAG